MYIQPPARGNESGVFTLPKGYSGNAFREIPPAATQIAETSPEMAESPLPEDSILPPESEEKTAPASFDSNEAAQEPTQDSEPATASAFAPVTPRGESSRDGGLLSRIPFLSSLLPPPRGERKGRGELSDWLIPGLIFFLMLDGKDDDIFPFLVALLLWN